MARTFDDQRWDEHCPHCEVKIEDLNDYFCGEDYSDEFEIDCPHCNQPIEVTVVAVPEFGLSKPEEVSA